MLLLYILKSQTTKNKCNRDGKEEHNGRAESTFGDAFLWIVSRCVLFNHDFSNKKKLFILNFKLLVINITHTRCYNTHNYVNSCTCCWFNHQFYQIICIENIISRSITHNNKDKKRKRFDVLRFFSLLQNLF